MINADDWLIIMKLILMLLMRMLAYSEMIMLMVDDHIMNDDGE